MKLATYRHGDGEERLGVINNAEVIDVVSLNPRLPSTMMDLLRAGADGMAAVRSALSGRGERVPLAGVTLAQLSPQPSNNTGSTSK
jgi:hypothetical protein